MIPAQSKRLAEDRRASYPVRNANIKKTEPDLEPQEIFCHGCGMYVQFRIDKSLDGNHTLNCPKCGHEHFRVVKNGEITDERWKSSGPTYNIAATSYTTMSVDTGTSSGGYGLYYLSGSSYYLSSTTTS